jgi:hypothetical protein
LKEAEDRREIDEAEQENIKRMKLQQQVGAFLVFQFQTLLKK